MTFFQFNIKNAKRSKHLMYGMFLSLLVSGCSLPGGFDQNRERKVTPIDDTTEILDESMLNDVPLDIPTSVVTKKETGKPMSLEQRLSKLENDVANLAQSFSTITKLENDIETLLNELRGIREHTAILPDTSKAHGTATKAPESLTDHMSHSRPQPILEKAKQSIAAKKKATTAHQHHNMSKHPDGNHLHQIRLGVDKIKTRLVLDVKGDAQFTSDFDAQESLFTITLTDLKASPDAKKSIKGGLVTASNINDESGNTFIALSIKPGANLINQGKISPNSISKYTRLFFDFAE